jgi:hypothetical protein
LIIYLSHLSLKQFFCDSFFFVFIWCQALLDDPSAMLAGSAPKATWSLLWHLMQVRMSMGV